MTTTKTDAVVAYKAFDKNWKCRGFQFEVGKTYEHQGKVRICEAGFHAVTVPFDVWNYYDLIDTKLAKVTVSGDVQTRKGDSKVGGAKITIDAAITLPDFIAAQIKAVTNLCGAIKDKIVGGETVQSASGDSSKLAASGDSSKLAASGNYSQLAASGHSSQLAASGNYSKLAASGYSSQLAASGNYSQLAASGDSSHVEVTGSNSVAAAIGPDSTASGIVGSWIVLASYKDDGSVACVATAQIDGKKLKANTRYKLTAKGKFVKAEG